MKTCLCYNPLRVGCRLLNDQGKTFLELLKGLNVQQQQAVVAGLGPVLVLAGPGSGKTRVLTRRIAYLIGALGVRPYAILAVTFTNKAAREMESRVMDLLGSQARGVSLGTFHAICARILRREAVYLPFEQNFVIFDADDQHSLVKRAIDDLNLDDKQYRPGGLHALISRAKNDLLLADDFPVNQHRDEVVKRVFTRYQQLLLANNALDFDDLLLWTARLLEQKEEVREKYARRYEHVLVDEFQDTNLAQYVLLKHLASFHQNVFAVGDTDQSIYRWRGADYRNVLRFEQDFPEAQVILLEQNYRSTQNILDLAMSVIDRNAHRVRKQLFTDRGAGPKIGLHMAYDDRVEATYVVEKIVELIAMGEHGPGDFAVMYRTNAQSRLLEEAFLHHGLRYKLVGAQRFYGRREVKDIIAYLRLVHNPQDEFSLMRVIGVPPRGIGDKTIYEMRTRAQRDALTPGEWLLEVGSDPDSHLLAGLPGRTANALQRFGSLLKGWTAARERMTPLELMDRILDDVDYQSYIDDGTDEGHDRWENVMELRRLAADFQREDLASFLEQVALVSDQDTLDENASVPTLLTLHAAKGLEFPVVFIIGLNDGTLPHSRSFEDPEAMEEERRLFYVGITRAMDRLFLVYAQNRSAYGFAEPGLPSRYLDELPDVLLDAQPDHLPGYRERRSVQSFRTLRWGGLSENTSASILQPRYQPGMRVEHPVWHEGMVLNSRIQDDDEIVDVFFEEVGLKRVAASLAKLEILS